MNIHIIHFDRLDSTNLEALRHAKKGAAEGLCIVANEQTAGRGRRGRKWISEKDAGIYFSIVLRPQIDIERIPLITLMAGVAVSEALGAFGIASDIKWVNDILVNDRKIAGILAETTDTTSGSAVVVGIGINNTRNALTPELSMTATSIEQETGGAIDRERLIAELTGSICRYYAVLTGEGGEEAILNEWARRSSYYKGKRVRVVQDGDDIRGVTDGLEPAGALRLLTEDGVRIIHAGDVELLRTTNVEQKN